MKINIISYADANYLPKVLICYKSLNEKFKVGFVFHLFCFDDIVYNIVKSYNYKNVMVYKRSEFETKAALKQKKNKKSYEYYWTYTPITLLNIMKKVKDNELVVYMDADLMFFSSPKDIFKELEDKDVLIQPNNFSVKERWQFDPIGYYCTSFQVFRNNSNTRKIVKEWIDQCINCCWANFTNNQFGEQKYIDYWRDSKKKVREITVVGANVAPWNIHKYDVSMRNNEVYINNNKLVYYHFHAFKMNFKNYDYIIEGDRDNHYEIRSDAIKNIYSVYIEEYKKVLIELKKKESFLNYIDINPEGNFGWYGENVSDFEKN